MAASKRQINFIFAVIVIALGSLAVTFIYMRSGSPVIRPTEQTVSSTGGLPENHPPVDVAQKLAALLQMGAEDPQNADIQMEIGNIYYDLGEYESAAASYQKSLDIRPGNPYIETDLATCFHYLGRDDEALKILDNILKYSPDFSQALYNKGIVLIHGKNDIEGGIAAWEELLKQADLEPARRAEIEQSIQQLKSYTR
jgi:tetratricopeptide (TPR) repeat protein